METSVHSNRRGILSARRLALLATVAAIGATALFVDAPSRGIFAGVSAAQAAAPVAQRMTGFADLVEKVKPAVISVRVKEIEGPQTTGFEGRDIPGMEPGSPADRFFRQFGLPEGTAPGKQ